MFKPSDILDVVLIIVGLVIIGILVGMVITMSDSNKKKVIIDLPKIKVESK